MAFDIEQLLTCFDRNVLYASVLEFVELLLLVLLDLLGSRDDAVSRYLRHELVDAEELTLFVACIDWRLFIWVKHNLEVRIVRH